MQPIASTIAPNFSSTSRRTEVRVPWCVTRRAPATCGELVQGVLNGRDFLINSPIDLFAEATARRSATKGLTFRDGVDFQKSSVAATTIFQRFSKSLPAGTGAEVTVASRVPRGKGLASSTSEITAAINAVAALCGETLSAAEQSDVAIAIEPSDGIYYPGVVIYDQIRGRVLRHLGDPPPLAFVIVDTGGAVDTVGFDRERFRAIAQKNEDLLGRAIDLTVSGFQTGDARSIARGATLSAMSNQEVSFKPLFEELLPAALEAGALGVNVAHTGTALGVMFDPRRPDPETLIRRVEAVAGAGSILGVHSLIGGGAR